MTSHEHDMSHDSVVGAIGHITVPIPDSGHAGEVVVAIRGGSEAYAAYSDQAIEKNVQVLVVEQRAPRSVIVTPFITLPPLTKAS